LRRGRRECTACWFWLVRASAVVVAVVDWAAVRLGATVTRVAVGSEVGAVASRFSVSDDGVGSKDAA
jgi:hypothetical protein